MEAARSCSPRCARPRSERGPSSTSTGPWRRSSSGPTTPPFPSATRELLREARRALRPGRRASAAGGPRTRAGSSASTSSPTRATTASSCCCPASSEPQPGPVARRPRRGRVASSSRGLDQRDLERAGIRTEDKGAIVALHWRGARERGRRGVAGPRDRERRPSGRGSSPHRGRKVLEIRPNVADQQGHRRRGADPDAAGRRRALRRRRPHRRRRLRGAPHAAGGRRPRAPSSASPWPPMRRRPRSRPTPTSRSTGPEGFVDVLRGAGRVRPWPTATCCG